MLHAQQPPKKWTLLVYMAANNDLAPFASKNLQQMQKIGSTASINVVVNYNYQHKTEKRSEIYFIEKSRQLFLKNCSSPTDSLDAGNPQTLIEFCNYAITHYPAEHYALIFWNHGTGILEPTTHNRASYLQLFSFKASYTHYAPKINNHALPIRIESHSTKAICFDDTSGNFLTEQDLTHALESIIATSLHKPFDLIGFDACLMAMVEIATCLKPFATYLVASQEVELGWGWNYELLLKPFNTGTISPKVFGIHIVNAYAKIYDSIDEYSLSLIDLQHVEKLKSNISLVAQLCNKLLCCKNKKDFRNIIHLSRNKHFCTHFDEPSFIDLAHFYQNILLHSNNYTPHDHRTENLWKQLLEAIKEGLALIATCVLHNKTGKKATKAHGLSIYFPENSIHYSYFDSIFTQETAWLSFLNIYLQEEHL